MNFGEHEYSDHSTRSHAGECSAGKIYLSTTPLETDNLHPPSQEITMSWQPPHLWIHILVPIDAVCWHSVTSPERLTCAESQHWTRLWLCGFKINEAQNLPSGCSQSWEFSCGPMVRTRRFHCQGPGSIPGQGTKIPWATQCSQKKKCSWSSEDRQKTVMK